ncbi:hypothetical protein Kfla_0381 [Kribbella flavida DSM 17836]|uniref:ParB/Sulfiredoxin domain-containing protein n=1 Tax=Kribbella flavida (strain DSM 17836 / JCM 10339 / NBRC 14399) TaxID=479435 RepID=D2PUI7_KRIFD|nr:hypothetical protein [Kribbella flavida]ADB29505.1 hypothetical protein Kfla_0381 [Kribbella flavida DSM 17836]
MVYSQFPIDEVSVSDLRLDVSNYRFPIDQPSEHAAMNYLFAASDVMEVVRLILPDGYVDNELPLVVEEDGGFVILEGNRRLSALRALLDPSLVPSHQTEIEHLLRRYPLEAADLPEKIRVMRFPDREAAAPVLARLHIGENKRRWNLDEQAKFVFAQLTDGITVRALKEQLPAIKDVVRLIRMGNVRQMLGEISFGDPALEEYAVSSKLPMSAFEYAYRNSAIQSAIGIAFDDEGNLTSRPSTDAHVAALARLLRGFKAGELNTRRGLKVGTDDFRRLIDEMRGTSAQAQDEPPAAAATSDASNAGDAGSGGTRPGGSGPAAAPGRPSGEPGSAAAAGDQTSRRGPNSPETKKTLDFAGIDEEPLPLPLKHRVRELRRIEVAQFPAAAAMLMRSVLESAIKEHYGVKGGPAATGMLSDVMVRITSDYNQDKQFANAISTINRKGRGASTVPGSGEWFNMVSHSVNIDVNGRQVHEAWRVVFPLVRFLLKRP